MAYTFDPIFAIDPGNPANVAANASITIFDPSDAAKTPLTLTTPEGLTFPNPLTTNGNGHAGAFMHATLGRVAWAGGGFEGFFTAHDSIKQDAVAAKDSAAASAVSAQKAVDAAYPPNTYIKGSYAILNPGAPGNSVAGTAGTVYLSPVFLRHSMPITELWSWCTTAVAATTMEFGYYTNDAAGLFTRQLSFGAVDTATTGAKILAGAWTIPAGFLWFAFLPLGGAPTMRGTGTPMIPPPHQVSSGNTTPFDDVKLLIGPTSQTVLPTSFTASAGGPNSIANPVRFAVKAE